MNRTVRVAALAALVLGCRQKDVGVPPLSIVAPPHFLQPELVAIKVERAVQIADAQHGMKIAHENLSRVLPKE